MPAECMTVVKNCPWRVPKIGRGGGVEESGDRLRPSNRSRYIISCKGVTIKDVKSESFDFFELVNKCRC